MSFGFRHSIQNRMLQSALRHSTFNLDEALDKALHEADATKSTGYLSTARGKFVPSNETDLHVNIWGSHGALSVSIQDVPLATVVNELALLRDVARRAKELIFEDCAVAPTLTFLAKLSPCLVPNHAILPNGYVREGDIFDELLDLLDVVLSLHREGTPELAAMICETIVHLCSAVPTNHVESVLQTVRSYDNVDGALEALKRLLGDSISTAAKLVSCISDPKRRHRLSETGRISIAAAAIHLGAGLLLTPAFYPLGGDLPDDLGQAIANLAKHAPEEITWGSISWVLAEMLTTNLQLRHAFEPRGELALESTEEPGSPNAHAPLRSGAEKGSLDLTGIFCTTPLSVPASPQRPPQLNSLGIATTPTAESSKRTNPYSKLVTPLPLTLQLYEMVFTHSYHFSANVPTTFEDGGSDLRFSGSWVSKTLHSTVFRMFEHLPSQLWVTLPTIGVIGALEGLSNAIHAEEDDSENPSLSPERLEVLHQLLSTLSSGHDWYSNEGNLRLAGICFCTSSLLASSRHPRSLVRDLLEVRISIEPAGIECDTPYTGGVPVSEGCSLLGAVAVSLNRVAGAVGRHGWADPSEGEVSLQRGCLALIRTLLICMEDCGVSQQADDLCGTSIQNFTPHFVSAVLSSNHNVSQWSYSWCLQTGVCDLISTFRSLFENTSHVVGLLLTSKLCKEALFSPGVAFCATRYIQLAENLCVDFPEVPRTYGGDILLALTTFAGGLSKLADPEFSDFSSAWLSFAHSLLDTQEFNILLSMSTEKRSQVVDQVLIAVSNIFSNALRSHQLSSLSGDTTVGFGCTRFGLTALHQCAEILSNIGPQNPVLLARLAVPCNFSVMHTSSVSLFFILVTAAFDLEDSNLVEMLTSVALDVLYHNPNALFQHVKATVPLETRIELHLVIHEKLSRTSTTASHERTSLCRVALCRAMFAFDPSLFYGLMQPSTSNGCEREDSLPFDWFVNDLKILVKGASSSLNRGVSAEALGLLSDLQFVDEVTDEPTAPSEEVAQLFKELAGDSSWPWSNEEGYYKLILREVMWQAECGMLVSKSHARKMAASSDLPIPKSASKEMKPLNLNDSEPEFTVQQGGSLETLLLSAEALVNTLDSQLGWLAVEVATYGGDAQSRYTGTHSYIADGSVSVQHALGKRSQRTATHFTEQTNISLRLQNRQPKPSRASYTVNTSVGEIVCYDGNASSGVCSTSIVGSADATIRRKHCLSALFDKRNHIRSALILTPDNYELDEDAVLHRNRCPVIYGPKFAVASTSNDALYNLCLSTIHALTRIIRAIEAIWLTFPATASSCSPKSDALIIRSVRVCVSVAALCRSPSRLTHAPLEQLLVRSCDTVLAVHASGIAKVLEDFDEVDPEISDGVAEILHIVKQFHDRQYVVWSKALLAVAACRKYTAPHSERGVPNEPKNASVGHQALTLLADMLSWPKEALLEVDVVIRAAKIALAAFSGVPNVGIALSSLLASIWKSWYAVVLAADPNASALSKALSMRTIDSSSATAEGTQSDESTLVIGGQILKVLLEKNSSLSYELSRESFLNLFRSLSNDFQSSACDDAQWGQRSGGAGTNVDQQRLWHQVWVDVLSISYILVSQAPEVWAEPILDQLNSSTRVQQHWLPSSVATSSIKANGSRFYVHEVDELALVAKLYKHALRSVQDHDSKRLAAQWGAFVLMWLRDNRNSFRRHATIDSVDILSDTLDILFTVPFRTRGAQPLSTAHVSLVNRPGMPTFEMLQDLIRAYISYLQRSQDVQDADSDRLEASARTSPRKTVRSPSPVHSHISDDVAESEFRGHTMSDNRLRVTGDVAQKLLLFYLGNWMALYKSDELLSMALVQQLQDSREKLSRFIYRCAERYLVDGVLRANLQPSLQSVLQVMERIIPILEAAAQK